MPIRRLPNILLSVTAVIALAGISPAATPNSPEKAPTTTITACGTVIDTPGTYILSYGLSCSNDGVDITSSNVTLQFMNNARFTACLGGCYPTQTAVKVYDPAGGPISNVNISGCCGSEFFPIGVSLAGAQNSQITGLSILFATTSVEINNSANGDPSRNDLITANGLTGTSWAIQANSLYSSTVIGNAGDDGLPTGGLGIGRQLLDGNNNVISGNSFVAMSIGIELGGTGSVGATHNTLEGNTAQGNTTGILVSTGADGNRFRANSVRLNSSLDINEGNASCGQDVWTKNLFTTANQTCIH
jgi:parallel beta-helix repeat protein